MTAMDIVKLETVYPLTIDDYVLLSQFGALDHFAKTKLIEGVIVPVNALYSAHARAQRHFFRELDAACFGLQQGFEVFFQISAHLSPRTMPRPDVMIARHVPPNGPIAREDVALVVEITDTTHDVDLGPKPRIYADAGVPEYWMVDLKARQVVMMSSPESSGYAVSRNIPFGEPITAATIHGLTISTADL